MWISDSTWGANGAVHHLSRSKIYRYNKKLLYLSRSHFIVIHLSSRFERNDAAFYDSLESMVFRATFVALPILYICNGNVAAAVVAVFYSNETIKYLRSSCIPNTHILAYIAIPLHIIRVLCVQHMQRIPSFYFKLVSTFLIHKAFHSNVNLLFQVDLFIPIRTRTYTEHTN